MRCKDCINEIICKYTNKVIPLSGTLYNECDQVEKIGCPFTPKGLQEVSNLLFKAAHMILRDECPPKACDYFCLKDEDFCETRCEECWSNYLYKVINKEDLK